VTDGAPTILHADLDAFYASVEQLLDPALRRRPVAVGGGVVLAASYEARAFGVAAGMPGSRARQLCPALTFVSGHFHHYRQLGDRVVELFHAFTPAVERVSIDEAFLDVRGARRLFGSAPEIAAALRRRVRDEVGLPLSVGVARTKHLAKVASQVAKPDGLVVVPPDAEDAFLRPLPVGLVWGVGPATERRLAEVGIHTVGELAAAPGGLLEHLLGTGAGGKLASLATNVDPRRVAPVAAARSVGAQAALGRRRPTAELLRTTLGFLADRVAGRLRAAGRGGRTVAVRVRFGDFRCASRRTTVTGPVASTRTLTELALELAGTVLGDHGDEDHVTLLGVSVSNLVRCPPRQLELGLVFGDAGHRPASTLDGARWSVDRSVDAVRARFGSGAVGYAAVTLSRASHVPDGFRELAEHRLGTSDGGPGPDRSRRQERLDPGEEGGRVLEQESVSGVGIEHELGLGDGAG